MLPITSASIRPRSYTRSNGMEAGRYGAAYWLKGIGGFLRRYCRDRQTTQALDQFSDHDLEDIGLYRNDSCGPEVRWHFDIYDKFFR
jgi:uncharacterized protein YjiS (DUF1127 family)